jgi:hypothetical protein
MNWFDFLDTSHVAPPAGAAALSLPDLLHCSLDFGRIRK